MSPGLTFPASFSGLAAKPLAFSIFSQVSIHFGLQSKVGLASECSSCRRHRPAVLEPARLHVQDSAGLVAGRWLGGSIYTTEISKRHTPGFIFLALKQL